ncbi:MAG: hypothetical protein ACXU89_25805, partial [Xanthobacteraceae bacterium]
GVEMHLGQADARREVAVADHESLPGLRCKRNFVPRHGIADWPVRTVRIETDLRDLVRRGVGGTPATIIVSAANVDPRRLHALRL